MKMKKVTQEEVEQLASKVNAHLRKQNFDYSARASSCNDGEISVFVDTYEVVDDTRGCMDDIISACAHFPELEHHDTECHEMVVVSFKVEGFEDEDEEDYED